MNKVLLFLILCYSSFFSFELSAQLKGEIVDFVEEVERYNPVPWEKDNVHAFIHYLVIFRNGEIRTIVYKGGPCKREELQKFFQKGKLEKGDLVEISNENGSSALSFGNKAHYYKCIVRVPFSKAFNDDNQREGTFFASNPFAQHEYKERGNMFLITDHESFSTRVLDVFKRWKVITIEGFKNAKYLFCTGDKNSIKVNEYLEYIGPFLNERGVTNYLFKRGSMKVGFVENDTLNRFYYGHLS